MLCLRVVPRLRGCSAVSVLILKRQMRDKRTLTRRRAGKSGAFDPKTYDFRPSPLLNTGVTAPLVREMCQVGYLPVETTYNCNSWKTQCW
jgi:hypothetical protein